MDYSELYIDGRWQRPASDQKIKVLSASTEEVIGSIPEGTPADVDRAVEPRGGRSTAAGRKRRVKSARNGCASSPTR